MRRLIEFSLTSGDTVLVEIEDPSLEDGPTRVSSADNVLAKAASTLDEILKPVRPAAESLIKHLQQLSVKPQGVTIEFGLKLSATAGAIIAAASSEGNFRVTLRW